MPQLTTIQLTDIEAKMFIMMRLLQSMGVFDIKSGSVELHFTSTGEIGGIDIHRHLKIV